MLCTGFRCFGVLHCLCQLRSCRGFGPGWKGICRHELRGLKSLDPAKRLSDMASRWDVTMSDDEVVPPRRSSGGRASSAMGAGLASQRAAGGHAPQPVRALSDGEGDASRAAGGRAPQPLRAQGGGEGDAGLAVGGRAPKPLHALSEDEGEAPASRGPPVAVPRGAPRKRGFAVMATAAAMPRGPLVAVPCGRPCKRAFVEVCSGSETFTSVWRDAGHAFF